VSRSGGDGGPGAGAKNGAGERESEREDAGVRLHSTLLSVLQEHAQEAAREDDDGEGGGGGGGGGGLGGEVKLGVNTFDIADICAHISQAAHVLEAPAADAR
jgi:hypothetical protein